MATQLRTTILRRKYDDLKSGTQTTQQRQLLQRLYLGPIDTLATRIELNILHPGGRVLELRAQGYKIHTQRITLIDERGRAHRGVALYSLTRPTNDGVAAIHAERASHLPQCQR